MIFRSSLNSNFVNVVRREAILTVLPREWNRWNKTAEKGINFKI